MNFNDEEGRRRKNIHNVNAFKEQGETIATALCISKLLAFRNWVDKIFGV